MIPKIIYDIWLNDNPKMPPMVEMCYKLQQVPGYEHRLITLENCYRNKYIQDAIDAKQWGKASDYLRCYYLIQTGGIHLDADVFVLPDKNFDHLLDSQIFAGAENNRFVNTAVMGAVKDCQLLKDHLEEVERRFKGNDGLFFESSVEIFTYRIYGARDRGEATILSPETFYPYDHQRNTIIIKDDTITFHLFMKSWK